MVGQRMTSMWLVLYCHWDPAAQRRAMSVARTIQLMLFGYLLFIMRTMHLYSVGKMHTKGMYRNHSALKR